MRALVKNTVAIYVDDIGNTSTPSSCLFVSTFPHLSAQYRSGIRLFGFNLTPMETTNGKW